MSLDDKHIGFIGAGAMAGALAGGLLAGGTPRERVSAADPDGERARRLAKELGIRVGDDNAALVEESDVVVVAVKPAVVCAVSRNSVLVRIWLSSGRRPGCGFGDIRSRSEHDGISDNRIRQGRIYS